MTDLAAKIAFRKKTRFGAGGKGRKRFVPMDVIVGTAAVLALVTPFLIRSAAIHAPQAAERAEISDIRPIDLDLGYREQRDEAAFFEAQGMQPPIDVAAFEPGWAEDTPAVSPQPIQTGDIPSGDLLAFADDLDSVAFDDADIVALNRTQPVADVPEVTATPAPIPMPPVAIAPPRRTPLPGLHPAHRKTAAPVIAEQPLAPPAATPDPASDPKEIETIVVRMDAPGGPRATPVTAADAEPEDPVQIAMADTAPTATDSTPSSSAPRAGRSAKIALVITAAGLNRDVTRFAIDALPAGVTLAFAPVKPDVGALAEEAKGDGHTVLVEIPMEPINKRRDPGAMTLRVSNPVGENLKRLEQALARVPVASGASSYLGAKFNAVEQAADPVVRALGQRGLFFFENQPTQTSVLEALSARSNLPYAKGTTVIDADKSARAIRAALDALERRARATGRVSVGVGSALRSTISTVDLWAKEAQKRGVEFVPVTEVRR